MCSAAVSCFQQPSDTSLFECNKRTCSGFLVEIGLKNQRYQYKIASTQTEYGWVADPAQGGKASFNYLRTEKMKKFAMAAVAAAALSAGVAQAYTVGTFSSGFVVCAVGANTVGTTTAANACNVANAAGGMGVGAIGANAFQVNTAAQDVAFVPVIDGPLTLATGSDLTTLGPLNLLAVSGARAVPVGPNATPAFSMRYAVDGTLDAGLETRIVVWSTGDHRGTHTVNMYDAAQNRKSVNF